uniref:Uncharacterized protein n=1 Tax=Rhizophora mucronata TaxID=61149 RepID=A0A2P2PXS3_RHIMU
MLGNMGWVHFNSTIFMLVPNTSTLIVLDSVVIYSTYRLFFQVTLGS